MTLQTELPLSAVRHRKPMVKRDGAKNVLDLEDWQLETAIDELDGVLNVASNTAARRDLRFAVVCLEEYQRCLRTATATARPCRSDAALAELIFGKPRPLVRAQWVKSRLMVHTTHFYALAGEGVIKLAKGSTQRSGPGGSAVVEWPALVNFIKSRRVQ